MNSPEREKIDKNVRRVVGISALRKIGKIVAEEQQADTEKARILRWSARYGWVVLSGCGLLLAYVMGLI